MKVGIISADPRKVCWKTYFYHGIWRRCRVSCEPPPWWYEPINPWYPPPTFDYEASVLPLDNSQPMYLTDGPCCVSESIAGGGVYVVSVVGGGPGYVEYAFSGMTYASHELHIRSLIPTWHMGCANERPNAYLTFYLTQPVGCYIKVYKDCTLYYGPREYIYFRTSYYGHVYLPYSDSLAVDVIRRPSSSTWDFYVNGTKVLSFGFSSITMRHLRFNVYYPGTYVGLDYLRVYIDKSADS